MAITLGGSTFWDSRRDAPVNGTPTLGSLTDGILIVSVSDYQFSASTIDGVSSDLDGAFTQLGSNVNQSLANAQLWYLLNPSSGQHTISVSSTDSEAEPTSLIAHWWSGVDQATPFGTHTTGKANSDSPSATVTTAAGEVVIDSLSVVTMRTVTDGADQTQIETNVASVSSLRARGHASYQAGADGGVMSYTLSSSGDWALIAAPLKPASAAVPATPPTETQLTRSRLLHTPLVRRIRSGLLVPDRRLVIPEIIPAGA